MMFYQPHRHQRFNTACLSLKEKEGLSICTGAERGAVTEGVLVPSCSGTEQHQVRNFKDLRTEKNLLLHEQSARTRTHLHKHTQVIGSIPPSVSAAEATWKLKAG